jgi:CheY-like chemotaxis protein
LRSAYILLIEDNHGDIHLVRHVLEAHGVERVLKVITDGEEALGLITQMATPGVPVPDLVLLDLNLPKVNGHQILRELRRLPGGADMPVVVLTSSDAPSDHIDITALGISHYFRKPMELDKYMQLGFIVGRILEDRGCTVSRAAQAVSSCCELL